MEICRFPVVQRPLESVPLPPRNRVRSNSMSRTLPASPNLLLDVQPNAGKKKAKRETVKTGGLRVVKTRPEGTPTAILPSPSSPSGGAYVPLPLPSIVPLPSHQLVNPFLVCPPVSSPSSSSSSSPSCSPLSSPNVSAVSTSTQQRSMNQSTSPSMNAAAGPFFLPVSPATLTDANLVPSRPLQIARSHSASPDPTNSNKRTSASDSKKRPRSASTPNGAPGASSPSSSTSSLSGELGGSGNGHRSKRKRKTPEQLALLEKEFETNPMPNKDVREHLSQNLGLTSRQVQIWFQNKRAKVKNNRGGSGSDQGSPQEASSPEGSPAMISLPLMMTMMEHPPTPSPPVPGHNETAVSSPMTTYQPAPPSPSSAAAFQQFSSIDSFFEPSYFDLLLDAPFNNNTADYLLAQQTA